jgi:hypothetical protein
MIENVGKYRLQSVLVGGLLLALAGCAHDTVETRKHERWMAYSALPQEQRELVDQGKIRIGMSMDAVFIAWGKPSEVLNAETEAGLTTTWRYHGSWAEEAHYWTYREVQYNNQSYLERYLETSLLPRSYVRAEIIFAKGKVASWRTLPKPLP